MLSHSIRICPGILRKMIVTPHLGEMARLTGRSD